jgi:hypothetical protein
MAGSTVFAQTRVDYQSIAMLTYPGGEVSEFMNNLRIKTANHLQRNAPRNSPLNELHRKFQETPYADSFVSDRYGNQYSAGFRMGNTARHAKYVEYGRKPSYKYQEFSWKYARKFSRSGTPGRVIPGGMVYTKRTGSRKATNYMRDGVYYVAIRSGRREAMIQ